MSDVEMASGSGRSASTGEVPVNPYSLLEAVNSASGAARSGWALFLGIMTYVMIAVAGVTHKDLLLNSRVDLPILQVDVELTRFFIFAPLVLLFIHFGLLMQHVMLARKVVEFDIAVRPLEASRRRTHPLRLELHSYFYTIALAGPARSLLFGGFLHAMIWLSFVALPVLILLYIQIQFLPYHDPWTTWVHRIALLTDVFALIVIGVFLRRTETSFFGALGKVFLYHPMNTLITGSMITVVVLFSMLVATIPGERMDTLSQSVPRILGLEALMALDESTGTAPGTTATSYGDGVTTSSLAGLIFADSSETATGIRGLFHRNLIVTDEDLVADGNDSSAEISVNLRERNLRNAVLNRSDLHRADLTGADLTGARMIGTDLRQARMSCSDNNAVLTAELSREEACTLMRDANLSRADLTGANMQLAYLAGAKFGAATLDRADLRFSELTGSDFSGAVMRKTDLSGGADIIGANFLGALLQGADFSGSNLQGADFSSAALQGALFALTKAQAAIFQGAELDGATFTFARLQGADFSGATMRGADLSAAAIWLSTPPSPDDAGLSDVSRMRLEPLQARDLRSLEDAVESVLDPSLKRRLANSLAQMQSTADGDTWVKGPAAETWRRLEAGSADASNPAESRRLTRLLTRLACQVRWIDGSVASGLIQRALSPAFKGDIELIYADLTAPECAAAKAISRDLLQRLSTAIEKKRGTQNLFEAEPVAESVAPAPEEVIPQASQQ